MIDIGVGHGFRVPDVGVLYLGVSPWSFYFAQPTSQMGVTPLVKAQLGSFMLVYKVLAYAWRGTHTTPQTFAADWSWDGAGGVGVRVDRFGAGYYMAGLYYKMMTVF